MSGKEKQYYRIRRSHIWVGLGIMLSIVVATYFRQEFYKIWQQRQGRVDISYEGIKSVLKDSSECYLCGNSNRSMMGYYRKFDTIGLITLDDWSVVDLGLREYDGQGNPVSYEDSHSSSGMTNIGGISIRTSSTPSRGMASIDVSLQEDYKPNLKMLQENLCQKCLDKITASMGISKWKYEKKEAIPLCLVDFQTLEIYSLQDWLLGCSIGDYWVEIDIEKEEVEVKGLFQDSLLQG